MLLEQEYVPEKETASFLDKIKSQIDQKQDQWVAANQAAAEVIEQVISWVVYVQSESLVSSHQMIRLEEQSDQETLKPEIGSEEPP